MTNRHRPPQDPVKLLDFLIAHLGLKNDAALSKALGMTAPQISKMRHGYNQVSGDTLLLMHDTTGLSIPALRAVLHDVEREELAAA
jgi:plasmid maintenance system antidote protein VapI